MTDMTEPSETTTLAPPSFDDQFQKTLEDLLIWRRDVRRFRPDPISDTDVEELLRLTALSPSVGNAQPWRFVLVESPDKRDAIIANFERANADALADYDGERAQLYAGLKLSGLKDAPVHLAVYCDQSTTMGEGLGRRTMPEMLAYSVVGAITTLWLAARAQGIGLGWVSILDAPAVNKTLDVSEDWQLIGYLCMGYPVEEHADPELQRHGWQERVDIAPFIRRV
jgi:5,6-dimethylbenzimidazole synthase